ncbi:MAG: heavy metal translocating P-type ATPase [Solitalea-like symbiont of Acarus siro]
MDTIIQEPEPNSTKTYCYHCGLVCAVIDIAIEDKFFCCQGCKTVYQLLSDSGMCTYYNLNDHPGISRKNSKNKKFAILEDLEIQKKLIQFSSKNFTQVNFTLPQMHCSSCMYLLENLSKLNSHILNSRVDFLSKEINISFSNNNFSLRQCAELLDNIGYSPHLSLENLNEKKAVNTNKALIAKLGIAGFAFGNIMLLSIPEYISNNIDHTILKTFKFFIIVLSLPVFFYSATEFFRPALNGLKKIILNIDLPISMAIIITFIKSIYDIISNTSPGYLDSMTGIVFFMLIGRYVQAKTYKKLSFERDYSSYFPIAVNIVSNGQEQQISLTNLHIDDKILIKNNEIIPADSILISPKTTIDYSFVTGESTPIDVKGGELVYAGGRQLGQGVILKVIKEVSNSYLTQLWNNKYEKHTNKTTLVNIIANHFTLILFILISIACLYWSFTDTSRIFNVIITSLIIACPCALSLSANFTNATTINIFSKNSAYFKNHETIEHLSNSSSIVFDKTGTITDTKKFIVSYNGKELTDTEKEYIVVLAQQSAHPLSKAISYFLGNRTIINSIDKLQDLKEVPSLGLSAIINSHIIKLGSKELINPTNDDLTDTKPTNSIIYLSIDNEFKGYFLVKAKYRAGIEEMIKSLNNKFKLSVLSGDNDKEKGSLREIFGKNSELKFYQKPQDKLEYILQLQKKNHTTVMIGDGLNDAVALIQSNVGITITDNLNNFTPACDIIMAASQLSSLNKFLKLASYNKKIITAAFIFSIGYNIIGLYFSLQGLLHPVIAAILMPASSLTIIILTYLITKVAALILQLKI